MNGVRTTRTEMAGYLAGRMNFLGHLHLSGTTPLVIVGNFMADAVKGRDLSRFDPDIRKGIILHRAIDTFTDTHPLQRQGRERARDHAGRYASVVMDMYYDHLLAANWKDYHEEPLSEFAQRMYTLLTENSHLMPERTRQMLPYMVSGDWLSAYATVDGIGHALWGMSRRVPKGASMAGAERVLVEHLDAYLSEFRRFLPMIEASVAHLR